MATPEEKDRFTDEELSKASELAVLVNNVLGGYPAAVCLHAVSTILILGAIRRGVTCVQFVDFLHTRWHEMEEIYNKTEKPRAQA